MDNRERSPALSPESVQEVQNLKQEVARQSSQEIKQDFLEMAEKAVQIRQVVENTIQRTQSTNVQLEGRKDDKNTTLGKAVDVKQAVQRILLSAKVPDKIPTPDGPPSPAKTKLASDLIQHISERIDPEKMEISEQAAPYLYNILQKTIEGKINSIEDLAKEFDQLEALKIVSPYLHLSLQESLIELAIEEYGYIENVAKEMFKAIDAGIKVNPRTGQAVEAPVILTPRERKLRDDYSYRIHQSDMKYKEQMEIFESLRTGKIEKDVKTKLEQLGFTNEQIEEFADIVYKGNKYRQYQGSGYGDFDRYFPPEERAKFTVDYLTGKDKVFNKKGIVYLNEHGLTTDGKRMLKKSVLAAVNALFAKVDAQPGIEAEKSFSELREGYIFADIQDTIDSLLNTPKLSEAFPGGYHNKEYVEVTHWIKEGLLEEIGREKEYRFLYHNIGLWIKIAKPEDLAKHLAAHNVSEATSALMSDVSGKMVSLAMSEFERHLQFDIAINNGKVRPGLYAGKVNPNELFYDTHDKTVLKERFLALQDGLTKYIEMLKNMSPDKLKSLRISETALTKYDIENIQQMEEWEIERAIKYAMGIHLTQTLRGYEVPASARAPGTFEGGLFYDMCGNINGSWKWSLGRGIGKERMRYIKEMMLATGLVKHPEQSLWKRIFDASWNPKKIHDEIEKYSEFKASEKWEKIKDSWLYKDMSFKQLIKLFGIGGLYGRGGWRRVGFTNNPFENALSDVQRAIIIEAERAFPEYKNASWKVKYQMLAQVAGVGTRFWYDGDRAGAFAKKALWEQLGIDISTKSDDDLDKIWAEYTEGKKGGDVVFTTPDGDKFTAVDLVEIKTTIFQGLNFKDLLNRSPLDFLNNLLNLQPELLAKGLGGETDDLFFEFGGTRDNPTLNDAQSLRRIFAVSGLTGKDLNTKVEKVLTFQREMKRIWGEGNFKHLKYIKGFFNGFEAWGRTAKDGDGKLKFVNEKGEFDKNKLLEYYFRQLDLASEKVKLRKDERMSPEDINDIELRKLFFGEEEGEKGIIKYFNDLNEDFGGDDKLSELGERGFFYHMARGWYNELGTGVHPNTSDVDWRYILHNIGEKAGETLVKRLWGDMGAWNEVMNGLMNLDELFAGAATSHSMDKIIEFQLKMLSVKGICGIHAMYEMQYYFAQLVTRYFYQHAATRIPILGSVFGLFNAKELSLSRIYNGAGAFVLTSDGMNAYFQQLRSLNLIAPDGQYGFDRLAKSMGADWQKLAIAEIAPNILIAIALFLLLKFISGALSEAEGKKK